MRVCWSFILYGLRGQQNNVSFFCNWSRGDWCFQRTTRSAHCNIANAKGMWMGAVHTRQTIVCFPIFYFLQLERATKQRLPLLQLKTWGLMLPTRCYKRSLQHSTCRGDVNRSSLSTTNKHCLPIFFFTSGEDDEATSPSFKRHYVAIEASSTSLEELIASLLPASGTRKEAIFPMASNLLIAVESFFV